mgnify:CR=1 FL=1|jgi:hypothetical protein
MRSMPSYSQYKSMELGESHCKILVKQSYVLLVWFFYLTSVCRGQVSIPGFFVYPKKVTKFTILKAPMAHKTFSQEQVAFSSYSFSLTLRLESEASIASSKDAVIYFLKRFSSISLFYGTNMLFLKSFSVFFFVQDRTFFSYHAFSKRVAPSPLNLGRQAL